MKRFNINEFIWFLILGVMFVLLAYSVYTEKIFLIVNSDMRVYVYIAMFIIALMMVIQCQKIFTISARGGVKFGYLIFVFSIICLWYMTKIDIVKTSLEFKEVNLYHELHSNSSHNEEHHIHCIDDERIVINNDNFHERLEELIHHVDEYVGKEVEITGIVYNDSKYEDKFIVTNLDMNCCIVDSSYLGVLCKDNIKLENGTEVTVQGKISKVNIEDIRGNKIVVPLIEVSNIYD